MTEDTINTEVTMGGATDAHLAGRYRVVRQLGQGGMGSVWLAEDTQLDNRQVAIKMLPSILVSNKRAYNQLKSEALVSLKLTHPNIATLRAFEENGGNPFLVVDFIDGQTLDDYLAEKGKLTEDETIRLLAPVAAALDYAHSKGVVHRDVKPANVMIRKDGHPFVLDFGIAREIQETLTRVTGKLSSGTLMYMSPEQLNGDAPSAAQDIYSFAAMAYECLTGAPPFARGNVEFQIMNKDAAPLDPHIAISGSVMAGLAKDAASRPALCSAVLDKEHFGHVSLEYEDEPHMEVQGIPKSAWSVIVLMIASCFGFPVPAYVKDIRRSVIFAFISAVGPLSAVCFVVIALVYPYSWDYYNKNDYYRHLHFILSDLWNHGLCCLLLGGVPSTLIFVLMRPLRIRSDEGRVLRTEKCRFNAVLRILIWIVGFVAGLLLAMLCYAYASSCSHEVGHNSEKNIALFWIGITFFGLMVSGVSVAIVCLKYRYALLCLDCADAARR